jgi:hypothetical protein
MKFYRPDSLCGRHLLLLKVRLVCYAKRGKLMEQNMISIMTACGECDETGTF